MSPEPQVDVNLLEETRKKINFLVSQIARDSESDMPAGEYYSQFLQRVREAVAAPAAAVWLRTLQGHLQLQHQINIRDVGIDKSDADRQTHDELLRQIMINPRPQMVPPRSGSGQAEEGRPAPGNPTDYVILLAPIMIDKVVAGMVEVWQDADRNPNAQHGFLQFITRMAELASSYTRNNQLRTMVGQQTLWTQLETFARQIHGSLNPMEVGYQVANEGRRLLDCDRVSVGLRMGKRTRVEAVSGADVVERRSNLIRLMCSLYDAVLKWGEKLIYQGVKDDSLPPAVLNALDAYLAESNAKLLVVLPLKDEREGESKKPPRSAMMMECFDPSIAPEQMIARLEVVGKHATSALYNAAEHRRIPMRFVWQPLAKLQEGLGGKARAITIGVLLGLVGLGCLLYYVPYPLKMDAKGQLLPKERRYVFAPRDGKIVQFKVVPGQDVEADDDVAIMHDPDLAKEIIRLNGEISQAAKEVSALEKMLQNTEKPEDQAATAKEKAKAENARDSKQRQLLAILLVSQSASGGRPGDFVVKSPLKGTILNQSFQEELTNRLIKPNDPILRVGNKQGSWEIELKIPQKHIGQVLKAYDLLEVKNDPNAELDVDLILRSSPTRTFKAKLARRDIGGEATPNRDDNNESEPVVVAYVRIDGPGIDPDSALPRTDDYLVTGTEVVAKVRCGSRRMGYSLFYGVWEFFYEKVVFFF